jgi:hypothetical protein
MNKNWQEDFERENGTEFASELVPLSPLSQFSCP